MVCQKDPPSRDHLSILPPHLTQRVLGTMSQAAWHQHGDEDPIKVARALSKVLDEQRRSAGFS